VGARLSRVAGPDALLTCIGGDCFVLFVRARLDEVTDLLSRLRSAIAEPYDLDQTNIFITASIGVTYHDNDADTAETLIQQAEMASHTAKTQGGNRYVFHTMDMEIRFSRRSDIVQALRQALQGDEFELAFQPKYALSEGFPHIGAEALLRWNSPLLGRIGPAEFIPVAEAAGVISEIDFHVMGIFARQLGAWQRVGILVPASMNLSPLSFENPTLAPHLLALLADQNVPCDIVTIEITETCLVSASRNAVENIARFQDAGIRLSVDDFGTGHSSLSYLQRLIVSEVKIDQSFIQKIGTKQGSGNSEVLVRTILKLAKSFGLSTVAEGVENMAQLNWLRQEGCDAIQGYLGGKATLPQRYEQTVLSRGRLFGTQREPSH
jgi:EAL domain-containing protein (putative c-di-GMP-specific phosphodiesterase class I)